MGEIRAYILEKTNAGEKITGSHPLQSWDLWKQGKSVQDIAESRNLSPLTVFSHLAAMYERGELLDIRQWVSAEETDLIQGTLPLFEEPYPLKDIFEYFQGRFAYEKIRLSIADYKQRR